MDDTVTSGNGAADSTGNGNNAAPENVDNTNRVTAKIGTGYSLNGVDEAFSVRDVLDAVIDELRIKTGSGKRKSNRGRVCQPE